MGWLTDLLVALLGLFLVLDGIAHLTRYKYGETFSALVWYLEAHHPILRVVVALLVILLGVHLVFRIP